MSRNKRELVEIETSTLSGLQAALSHCIEKILGGEMPADVGKTVASLSSVKISGVRAKLRFDLGRNERPESEFLEG